MSGMLLYSGSSFFCLLYMGLKHILQLSFPNTKFKVTLDIHEQPPKSVWGTPMDLGGGGTNILAKF